MIEKHIPALVPVLYIFSALAIPLLAAFWQKNLSHSLALTAVLCNSVLSLWGFVAVLQSGTVLYNFGGWPPPIGIEYVYDPLAAFILFVIHLVALFVLIHSQELVKRELQGKQSAYYSVVMLLLCGFSGMILTGDLFNLYVFIEIASLAGYALIGVGGHKKAPYAAFKYLILGTIGASFYLLGIGYLYFMAGTLNMQELAQSMPLLKENFSVVAALLLIVVGFGIKMALFPLHAWLPDAYTYAPSSSSALIAPIGTKVAAYALIRMLFFVFGIEFFRHDLAVGEVLALLSSLGILFGSIMAIAQKELKRMLAYSSISQIAYVGLGIGLATPFAFIGALLHILNHALMKALLFLVAGNLQLREGHSNIERFDASYSKKYPLTMLAFTVAALSMIGLPPFAGFFSKWYLVLGSIERAGWWYVAVILCSSLLNAVYFFRILEKVYLRSSDESPANNEVPTSMIYPVAVLAVLILFFGIFNTLIVQTMYQMMPQGLV
jgi:multicomponent Na+:H+ antiporter subunit D